MESKQYEYYAFISYKREDEKWAKWLQKKLESYGFPVSLRKDNPSLPSKIRPVFRDQSELSGGNLKEEIEKGLKGSKYLIVICSPRSARSPWVSKEVQYFIDKGKENYIIPFIIGGTPNSKDPEDECFPEGLRQLTGEKEILGININEMGRYAAVIKVIARMFGLRFDSLWQRYERNRKRKITGIVVMLIFSILLSAGFFFLYVDRKNAYAELEIKSDEIKLEQMRLLSQQSNMLYDQGKVLTAYKEIQPLLKEIGDGKYPYSPEMLSVLNKIKWHLAGCNYKIIDRARSIWKGFEDSIYVDRYLRYNVYTDDGRFFLYDFTTQNSEELPLKGRIDAGIDVQFSDSILFYCGSFKGDLWSLTNHISLPKPEGFFSGNWPYEYNLPGGKNNIYIRIDSLLDKNMNYSDFGKYSYIDWEIFAGRIARVTEDHNNMLIGDSLYSKKRIFPNRLSYSSCPNWKNQLHDPQTIKYNDKIWKLCDSNNILELYIEEAYECESLLIVDKETKLKSIVTPFIGYSMGNGLSYLFTVFILNEEEVLCVAGQAEHIVYNVKTGKIRKFQESNLDAYKCAHIGAYLAGAFLLDDSTLCDVRACGQITLYDVASGLIIEEFDCPDTGWLSDGAYVSNAYKKNENTIILEINHQYYSFLLPNKRQYIYDCISEIDSFWK